MNNQLLHTVEGLRDIHVIDTSKKNTVERNILNLFNHYGYEQVQTPTFEYYDIYHYERGTADGKNLYKFFNREGEILALRPDITPSIARYMATFYNHTNVPRRFCYLGNVFYNNENYQGKPREYTQAGVECIGLGNAEADAESIALAIKALLSSGLREFKIEVGHAGFFNGLAEEAGLDSEMQEEVRKIIDEKNYIGLEEIVNKLQIDEKTKKGLIALPTLFGEEAVLNKAKEFTNNKKSIEALDRIKEVYEILAEYNVSQFISFDLGIVSQLHYYTGIIFKGYTYDVGDSIVDGGRYDKLLSTFSYDAPAVGFAVKIDELLNAISRQEIEIVVPSINTLIIYNKAFRKTAIILAESLRRQGMTVELGLNGSSVFEAMEYGRSKNIGGMMNLEDHDTITLTNIATGESNVAKISDIIEGGL